MTWISRGPGGGATHFLFKTLATVLIASIHIIDGCWLIVGYSMTWATSLVRHLVAFVRRVFATVRC